MVKKLRYSITEAGPVVGHPQEIMEKVAEIHDFKILSSESSTVGDCWIFDIETSKDLSYMPSYIHEIEKEK